MLEQMVKEATEAANEAEKKYDEVCDNLHGTLENNCSPWQGGLVYSHTIISNKTQPMWIGKSTSTRLNKINPTTNLTKLKTAGKKLLLHDNF